MKSVRNVQKRQSILIFSKMAKPIINSLIFRKPIKYGFKYYYVCFFSEKLIELNDEVAEYIKHDDEVTLAHIQPLSGNRYSILPIFTYSLISFEDAVAAHTLSVDQLITASYEASTVYINSLPPDIKE